MTSSSRPAGDLLPRTVACGSCPFLVLKSFRKFSDGELKFVERFKIGEMRLKPGQVLFLEGATSDHLFTVLSGWLIKYKRLDEDRRQILNYAMPGDLLGLQNAVFGKMQHSVQALTDVTLCVFQKDRIWSLYKQQQGLGFDLTWIAAQEKSVLADFLVSVGQRTAGERIAFLLLELYRRAASVGLVRKNRVLFPFTQEHFADTIGFSLVHTNKRIAMLKRTGAFEWTSDQFRILDEARLVELAGRPTTIPGLRPFI